MFLEFNTRKAVTVKYSWKIIWLIVMPQRLGLLGCNILLDNPAIKFVEKVRPFKSIDAFLSDLFGNEQVKIGNTDASTDLIIYEPETNAYPFPVSFITLNWTRGGS